MSELALFFNFNLIFIISISSTIAIHKSYNEEQSKYVFIHIQNTTFFNKRFEKHYNCLVKLMKKRKK